MISTAKLIEELQHQPDFPAAVGELNARLEQEKANRREYYTLIHENAAAEFINGEIVYHSPVRRNHWRVSTRLSSRLNDFVENNQLGEVGVEKVMISLTRNDYEPDIVFFNAQKAATFEDDQMQFPAPDFIVEIVSKSTESIDRGVKFNDYAAHGVQEYWIIDPEQRSIEQFLLNEETFTLHQKLAKNGVIRSLVVTGFEIEIASIF